jgi:hypothetical protein
MVYTCSERVLAAVIETAVERCWILGWLQGSLERTDQSLAAAVAVVARRRNCLTDRAI